MKKNNSGFSLVELIVVIAIMAILAGIAVPTYVKYIDEAYDGEALTALDEIKTAAFAAGVKDERGEVSQITVSASNGKVTAVEIKIGDTNKAVTTTGEDAALWCESFIYYMNKAITDIEIPAKSSYGTKAQWTADKGWEAVTTP